MLSNSVIEDSARVSSNASRTTSYCAIPARARHRNIQNTLLYTQLVSFESDEFHTTVAENVEKACKLIEAGFEYVTGEYADGGKIARSAES